MPALEPVRIEMDETDLDELARHWAATVVPSLNAGHSIAAARTPGTHRSTCLVSGLASMRARLLDVAVFP
jgi:hypothetical protein